MVTQAKMDAKLFGAFVDGERRGAVGSGRGLGDDFDGHMVPCDQVLGLEDHAERARIEWRDCLISSVEYNAIMKVVAHALHGERQGWVECGEDRRETRKVYPVARCRDGEDGTKLARQTDKETEKQRGAASIFFFVINSRWAAVKGKNDALSDFSVGGGKDLKKIAIK